MGEKREKGIEEWTNMKGTWYEGRKKNQGRP